MDTRVLIAGAGPVGLTMALLLARKGVPLRIVDKAPARTALSKALVVCPRTLELFEIEGLARPLLDAGMPARGVRLWGRDEPLLSLDFGDARTRTDYPFALMIPQRDTERILEDRLARLGVAVERRVELTGFVAEDGDDAGVTVHLSRAHDGGTRVETCRADWLLGCDGAHSTVRHGLPAARFDGDTLPTRWVLADVTLDGALPHDTLSMFLGRDGILAAIPFGAGRFRLIADVGEGAGTGAGGAANPPPPTLDDVQALLDARCRLPATASDPQWIGRIVINERKVRDYRHGRVFLAGDAAHVHSPAGGQGMNTGMQDAFNLAWKLALVCAGDAAPSLLDGYSPERSAIGDQVLKNAGNLTRLATVRNPVLRRLRGLALGALGRVEPVRRRLVDGFCELDLHYGAGSLTPGPASALPHRAHAIPPGARVPNRPLGATADAAPDAASLYALLAQGRFVVLSVGRPAVALPPGLQRLAVATAMPPAPEFEDGLVYVVRPDAYLLCSARADDDEDVAGAMAALAMLRSGAGAGDADPAIARRHAERSADPAPTMNYAAVGKFLYGAARFGGSRTDVERWMAEDLGTDCPDPGNHAALGALYHAFFAKYADAQALQANYDRFMRTLPGGAA